MDRQTVFLDELTEPEVAELVAGGTELLLIPTGSTEQHGPHGPIGTDVIIPREVCRRVAVARDALVAPPVPYGLAAGHRGFAGLGYVSAPTYLALIEDLILSFVESGFRRIVFVNGHYTNYPAINLACFNASPKLPEGVAAWALSYWDTLPPDEAEAYLSLKNGLHANIGETSAVMAVRPELVKLDRAVEGWPPVPGAQGARDADDLRLLRDERRLVLPRACRTASGATRGLECRARRAVLRADRPRGRNPDRRRRGDAGDVGRQRAAAVSRPAKSSRRTEKGAQCPLKPRRTKEKIEPGGRPASAAVAVLARLEGRQPALHRGPGRPRRGAPPDRPGRRRGAGTPGLAEHRGGVREGGRESDRRRPRLDVPRRRRRRRGRPPGAAGVLPGRRLSGRNDVARSRSSAFPACCSRPRRSR